MPPSPVPGSDRLWACHEHAMIGSEREAFDHRQAHGCGVDELSQEVSDAVRAEWRKQATHFDPALVVEIVRRARNGAEADSPSANPGSPFGV